MRHLIFSLSLFLCFSSRAQVFHIPDTSALLVKTTSQSPAHWYIEVFSDISTDTVLRWKATHFDNVPVQWQISMDDQTTFHANVQVGDSGDFNLLANQAFATKLIIGAMLNGTPGHGICYFDVYDPDNASVIQEISYEFIVTPSTNAITELNEASFLEWKEGILKVKDEREAVFQVSDLSGRIAVQNKLTNQLNISDLPKNQVLLIQVKLDNKQAIIKIYN
ncbi:hypothetical protein [Fluviicola sp.]|uniref:hypothetical protein n=1 Tax=Fluviicola sp. TaxID=1917219 RepID=UPI0031D17A75